jgi:hypothetical protein
VSTNAEIREKATAWADALGARDAADRAAMNAGNESRSHTTKISTLGSWLFDNARGKVVDLDQYRAVVITEGGDIYILMRVVGEE